MLVIISALAAWPARTKAAAAIAAVSLLHWDMLPPRVFPRSKLDGPAMMAAGPWSARAAARRLRPRRTLTDRSTVACPKLNVKPGKGWNLRNRVHASVRRFGQEFMHRLLQPRAFQIARDEDDSRAPVTPAPARQHGRRMEQMLDAVDGDRCVRSRDVKNALDPQQIGTAHRDQHLDPVDELFPRNRLFIGQAEGADVIVVAIHVQSVPVLM